MLKQWKMTLLRTIRNWRFLQWLCIRDGLQITENLQTLQTMAISTMANFSFVWHAERKETKSRFSSFYTKTETSFGTFCIIFLTVSIFRERKKAIDLIVAYTMVSMLKHWDCLMLLHSFALVREPLSWYNSVWLQKLNMSFKSYILRCISDEVIQFSCSN